MVPTIGFSLLYALLRGVLDDVANYQICYGAIVGEDAQTWSGVVTVGRKAEWPGWNAGGE